MARKVKKLTVRDNFIILTNGKQSEKNYFEAVRTKFVSLYKITVKFLNRDPEGLVNYAVEIKNDSNCVWCVFDKDEFPTDSIKNAIYIARQNEIGIAISNAAFEVWLINHLRLFGDEKNQKELLDVLDKELKQVGYVKGYKKNDLKVINEVFLNYIDEACNNSDIVYQRKVSEYKGCHYIPDDRICEWNSCTTVHKLIEALQISGKE